LCRLATRARCSCRLMEVSSSTYRMTTWTAHTQHGTA
jgi:hypothetical protein